MDVDSLMDVLASAAAYSRQGQDGVARSLLAQAEGAYAADPAYYDSFSHLGIRDLLENTRLEVTGRRDTLAIARSNAEPESLGIFGSILTNRTVGNTISSAAGTMDNFGLLPPGSLQSGQDYAGKRDGVNPPKLPGCSSLPSPLAWACENPGKVAIGAGVLTGLWVFGPAIVGKVVQTKRAFT